MGETGDRVQCPKCGANNFPSSAACWQCGEPLPTAAVQASAPPPQGPAPVGSPPGPTPRPRDTNTLIIIGWILVGLGFLTCCCGPLFAIPGIILGIVAYSKGDQRGLWIIIVGVVALVVGGGINAFWGFSHRWSPYFRHQWMNGPWRAT